jgi:predicted esterase
MSHGINDEVLPIDQCSRRIERQLRAAGYGLDYREFDGSHVVPDTIATAFLSTLVRTSAA